MRITIDTDLLKKEGIELNEFLLLLMCFYECDYKSTLDSAVEHGLVSPNLFKDGSGILSDNVYDKIARILLASHEKLKDCPIKDFYKLASDMQNCFPKGCKPGTSYTWRGNNSEIAFKLMMLVVKHDFMFTEEEAIRATKQYVIDCKDNPKYMSLLKYFILKTYNIGEELSISSPFMSIIENNRQL